jgi:hypothetical protein
MYPGNVMYNQLFRASNIYDRQQLYIIVVYSVMYFMQFSSVWQCNTDSVQPTA